MLFLQELESIVHGAETQELQYGEMWPLYSNFLLILLEYIDALAYSFIISPFLYNVHDRFQSMSDNICNIIKLIEKQIPKQKHPADSDFLLETQERCARLCRNVLTGECSMQI